MKKFLSVVLAMVISVLCIVPVFAETEAETVTEIRTADDLNNIRNNLSGKYILMSDIDLSSYENWEPIGTSETPFTGELDGNGYLIKNLKIIQNKKENIYAGIFAYCQNSSIKNILINNSDIQTNSEKNNTVGIIAATIKNTDISNCLVSGTVNVYSANKIVVGGIVGTASENSIIYRCKNLSNISTLMEYNKPISIYNYCVGGIVGSSYATVSECSNHGNIETTASGEENIYLAAMQAGGITGIAFGEIANCYNTGNITAAGQSKKTMLGGIAGYRMPVKDLISVFSIGNICCNEDNAYIGSIAGYLDEYFPFDETAYNAIVANCYFVESTKAFGFDNSEYKENILGLSESKFNNQNNFVGFDFENIWEMEENGYPVLQNQPVFAKAEAETAIEIRTADDLNNIRNNLSCKYILMNDINLSSYENWEPIGSSETPFTGELDGNGFTISNLTLKKETADNNTFYCGLFGNAGGSVIKNAVVSDAEIDVKYIGSNPESKCKIGTIAGYGADISNCAVTGKMNIKGFSSSEIGGIIGGNLFGAVSQCANYADINAEIDSTATKLAVGGIIGYSKYTEISECCNFGSVSAIGTDLQSSCYMRVGGIEGNGSDGGTVIDCYNRGKISVSTSNKRTYIGGISGQSRNTINVYSTGNVIIPEEFNGYSGAISGSIYYSALTSTSEKSEMKNAFYNNSEIIPAYLGKSIPENYEEEPFKNIVKLTEEEFKKQESFVGFDFETVWAMEENGYPVLQNQPVLPEIEPEPEPEPTPDPDPDPEPDPEPVPVNNVKSAEIVYVPLKNRIVFGYGSSNLPDGIVLKLAYNDGTEKTETIVRKDNGYYAGDECVFGSVDIEVVRYGCQTETIYVNDESVAVEYDYFVIPPIFHIIISLLHGELFVIA